MFDKQALAAAYELYRQRPSYENGLVLMKHCALWMRTRDVACLGIVFGVLDTLTERKHLGISWRKQWVTRAIFWGLRRQFKPERPGWNDYYMVRWQLTKNDSCAAEIHRRVKHLSVEPNPATPWGMVAFTAQWMADTVRKEDPEFDAALLAAEHNCLLCKVA